MCVFCNTRLCFCRLSTPVSNGVEQAGGCENAACSLDDEACPSLCAELCAAVAGLPVDAVWGSCCSPGTWRINFVA